MTLTGNYEQTMLGMVCPMTDERFDAEPLIDELLRVCRRFNFSRIVLFVIVDRRSTDGTLEVLRSIEGGYPELRVIYMPESACVVDACLRGYCEALDAGCDWILDIDAGFRHNPQELPRFFVGMEQGFDCVFGSRFCEGGRMECTSLKRYIVARGGTALVNLLLGTRLCDMTSGYALFTAYALRRILSGGIHSHGPFFQAEIKVHARTMHITEVPITHTSPGHEIGIAELIDAFRGLWHLSRLQKTLTPWLHQEWS